MDRRTATGKMMRRRHYLIEGAASTAFVRIQQGQRKRREGQKPEVRQKAVHLNHCSLGTRNVLVCTLAPLAPGSCKTYWQIFKHRHAAVHTYYHDSTRP